MRLCPWCGASLEGERRNKKFCSRSHAEMYNREFRNEEREIMNCKIKPKGTCYNCGEPVQPFALYCNLECGKQYRYKTRYKPDPNTPVREYKPRQMSMFPRKKSEGCTCGDYTHCLKCRNAERERAFRDNDIPVYMKPVYAQIHLSAMAGD